MNRIPSLFDSVEGNTVRQIHDQLEETNAEWMSRVRAGFAFHFVGQGVSTDDLWAFMDANDNELPPGASPNLLGSFFRGWDRARPTGQMIRSKRRGAHSNVLATWRIV